MLNSKLFNNDESNKWLIRQFEEYRFSGSAVEDKFLPRPDVSLIFHFGDCALISGETLIQLEPFFLGPIVPRALNLKFQGNMDTLAVTCKATVFSRLFDLDLSPVFKRSINLPEPIFSPLWQELANLHSSTARIRYFSTFINTMLSVPYSPDAIDVFYDKIVEKSINVPLKEIMLECHASKSTLLRKFVKRTGVSPKTLARIVRLNYLLARIKDERAIDYGELVFYGNYFDQSHFINDFKYIIGETPNYFFNRNLHIVKIFSGKPVQDV